MGGEDQPLKKGEFWIRVEYIPLILSVVAWSHGSPTSGCAGTITPRQPCEDAPTSSQLYEKYNFCSEKSAN